MGCAGSMPVAQPVNGNTAPEAKTAAPANADGAAAAAGAAAAKPAGDGGGDDLFATEKAGDAQQAGGSRMCTCYCCGQGYGPSSLPRHMDVCPSKREANYRDVPAHLRPPMPKPIALPAPTDRSTQAEINAYNAEAMRIYAAHKCACPKCGRLFEPNPFLVHLRAEKIDPNDTSIRSHTKPATRPAAAQPAAAPAAAAAVAAPSRAMGYVDRAPPAAQRLPEPTPAAVAAATTIQSAYRGHKSRQEQGSVMCFCYCCGRQYSSRDLPRHWQTCPTQRAANIRTSNLPPEVLRAEPRPPQMPLPAPGASPADFSRYNAEAQAIYKASMPQCMYCPRTFEPDRIMPHLRGCSFRPK